MLREVDPHADRYAAIVVPVNSYDDRDYEDLNDRDLDIRYLAPLLRVTDTFDFSLSFPGWSGRKQAALACLFKGLAYQRDIQDFLANFRKRLEHVRTVHKDSAGWIYDAVWTSRSMAGIQVDWAARKAVLPTAGFRPEQLPEMSEQLFRGRAPRTLQAAAYRRRWFGRIVAHYRGSKTRLVFLRLPRGPVVRPDDASDESGSLWELAAHGEIVLMGEHEFDGLERPELFGDLLHLNEAGSREFSMLLARKIHAILGSETAGRPMK